MGVLAVRIMLVGLRRRAGPRPRRSANRGLGALTGPSLDQHETSDLAPMPIPEFIVKLRERVGQIELWLPGVTAVIVRDDSILLVKRSDSGHWTPVTGIVEPGEDPGVAARREALEETGVTIRVDRLASVSAGERVTHANGDRAVYLDHTFACTWLSGDPYVADDESTDVGWFHRDGLPEMKPVFVERIGAACSDESAARFLG